jgi:hypothetical protein
MLNWYSNAINLENATDKHCKALDPENFHINLEIFQEKCTTKNHFLESGHFLSFLSTCQRDRHHADSVLMKRREEKVDEQ